MSRSSRIDWLLFVVLGFFWGSSYLFIKIGVDAGLPPFTLITLRLLFGFVLLATVVAIARANVLVRGGDDLMRAGLLIPGEKDEAAARGDFWARLFVLDAQPS